MCFWFSCFILCRCNTRYVYLLKFIQNKLYIVRKYTLKSLKMCINIKFLCKSTWLCCIKVYYNFIGMKQTAVNIWRFYLEGFRSMTLGRTLWLIILVKLFIMFFILRLFFFPRFLNTPVVGDDKEGYVSNELIHRSLGD